MPPFPPSAPEKAEPKVKVFSHKYSPIKLT